MVIIIETVGVGQSETTVRGMVDFVLLLMLAGAGDELQGIKKGILEIADGIAINKADGDNIPAAKRAQAELKHALHLVASEDQPTPNVVMCSATAKTGLNEIWDMIDSFKRRNESNGAWTNNRSNQHLLWMEESLTELILNAAKRSELNSIRTELEKQIALFRIYPPTGAETLWHELLQRLK